MIGKFFKSLGADIKDLGVSFADGDLKTKCSFLIFGFGSLMRGQIAKGLGFLAVQVLFIWYMISFGWKYLSKFTTLGTVETTKQRRVTVYGDNSFLILLFGLLTIILIICVSYALSRMRFKGRTFLMRFWLVLGMFPGFLTMICLYFLLKQFGLTQAGAVPGLILIGVASSGMGYYVCKGYFDTLPIALDEAARIDGASRAKILFVMTLPLSKPIIIYTALVSFMAPWCDYVFASYVAFGHDSSYNVAVALQRWVWTNDYQGYFTRFCAGGILIAIPVTVLFMFLQKYYVEGVTGGSVKG